MVKRSEFEKLADCHNALVDKFDALSNLLGVGFVNNGEKLVIDFLKNSCFAWRLEKADRLEERVLELEKKLAKR